MRAGERVRTWVLLTLLFAVHALANVVYVHQDWTMRSYDGPPHLEAQAQVHNVISHEGLEGLKRVLRPRPPGWWPIAGYLPWVAMSEIFGQGFTELRLYNLAFLALLLVSVLFIGRRIHSWRAGLMAAALVSFYPVVYGECRQFGVDFPSAAVLALNVLLLLRTDGLSRGGPSALFGAAVGLGMLIRPQTAFFISLPAAAMLAGSLWRPPGCTRPTVALNAMLALAAALAGSAIWWFGQITEVRQALLFHQQTAAQLCDLREPSPLFYLKVLPWALSPFLLLVSVVSLGGTLFRRRALPGRDVIGERVLWAWLAGGLIFLSIFRIHFMRFLLPLVPAIALLTIVGLLSIRHQRVRRALLGLALSMAAFVWLMDSFSHGARLGLGTVIRQPPSLASGPPRADPLLRTMYQVGQQLRRRHHSGHGVLVHYTESQGRGRFKASFYLGALLRMHLPGVRLSGVKHYQRESSRYFSLGGAVLYDPPGPVRHCYLLSLNYPRNLLDITFDLRQARRLWHRAVPGPEGHRVVLWWVPLSRCPWVPDRRQR